MVGERQYCDWIAADWGTSRLRVWAMRNDEPVAAASSDKGMGTLDRQGFEPALLELISPWLGQQTMTIVICGMAGSRQGWTEAPYAEVPSATTGLRTATPQASDKRLSVHILPGLKQMSPPDVMRGEETQIAGFLRAQLGFDGVLCLPGTHTKWVRVSAEEVVGFRTFMTGELFGLITKSSILRHTVGEGWDEEAFEAALADAISKPEDLAARLFAIRAGSLLGSGTPKEARARVSGLLIGAELAATRPYWLGQNVAVIGAEDLSAAYVQALALQGLQPERHDADAMTLAGLAAAHRALGE